MFKDRYTVGNVCLVVFLAFIFSLLVATVKVGPAAAATLDPGAPATTGTGSVTGTAGDYDIKVNVEFTPVTDLAYDSLDYYIRIFMGEDEVLLPATAFEVYTSSGVYNEVLTLVYTAASTFELPATFSYTYASVYQTVGSDVVYLDLFLDPPENNEGEVTPVGPVVVETEVGDMTVTEAKTTVETNTEDLIAATEDLPAGEAYVMPVTEEQIRPTMEYTIPAAAQDSLGDRQIVLPAEDASLKISLDELPPPTVEGATLKVTVTKTEEGANIGFVDKFGTGDFVAAAPSYKIELSYVAPDGTVEKVAPKQPKKLLQFTIEYDPTLVSDPNKLVGIQKDDDGNITKVSRTKVNTTDHTITMWLEHCSYYSVVESTKTFGDIASHWANADIVLMAARDVIDGQPNGNFEPDNSVTRAQFAAMLVRTMGKAGLTSATPKFTDAPAWAWYYGSVEKAAQLELVTGYGDGTYKPEAKVSRQEMAAMIVRAMGLFGTAPTMTAAEVDQALSAFADQGTIQAWARESAAKAVRTGIVTGRTETSFQPAGEATRAEAVAMLKRLLKYQGHIQ